MSIAVRFDKGRTQHYLDALANGNSIEAPPGAWTGNDMLALAGACSFGAMSQGPQSFWLKELPAEMHPEHREQKEEAFMHDLEAAIGFYRQLTMLLKDDEYDQALQPECLALVSKTVEGEEHLTMKPVKGFKEYPELI